MAKGCGLIASLFTRCTRLVRGEAGYADGAGFEAALIKEASPEGFRGEQPGAREKYTVVVGAGVALDYGEVFRRESDGLTFRVTSGTRDGAAPAQSSVALARCSAERWEAP